MRPVRPRRAGHLARHGFASHPHLPRRGTDGWCRLGRPRLTSSTTSPV
jgi:hypothetical protein